VREGEGEEEEEDDDDDTLLICLFKEFINTFNNRINSF
jgi:hypothetical protein